MYGIFTYIYHKNRYGIWYNVMFMYSSIVAGVCVYLWNPQAPQGGLAKEYPSDFTHTCVFKNQVEFQGIMVSTSTYMPTNGS